MIDHAASQPSPNGISTVDHTASQPSTIPHLSRDHAASQPWRHGSDAVAGSIFSNDYSEEVWAGSTLQPRSASSCAAPRRALESEKVSSAQSTSKSLGVSGTNAEPTPTSKPERTPSMRTKGKVVEDAEPAPIPKPKPETKRSGRIAEGDIPEVPNWIAYQNIVFFVGKNVDKHGNWLGGRLPRCKVCKGLLDPPANHKCSGYMPDLTRLQPMDQEKRHAIRTAAKLVADDWDDDHYDPTTEAGIHPVVRYGEEWDDDTYDPTTPEEVDLEYIADCEPSEGGFIEGCDEDDWIAWRRQQLGYSKDYDPSLDAADEQLDWDHEEYEDYEE